MHVHVQRQNGEAKFWLEPEVELGQHTGLAKHELGCAHRLIEEHADDIRRAWHHHFSG